MLKPNKKSFRTLQVGDTQILTDGQKRNALQDPYYLILNLSWPSFFSVLVTGFILLNLAFGTIYWLLPGSVANTKEGSFLNFFFFSVETLATVGYGVMSPANLAGHIVATIEIMTGMAGLAVTTGLVFARFSKPTARILFSKNVLIRDFEGSRVLMFRIANERHNRIVEANATVSLVREEVNEQNESFIRIHDLKLVRERTPVFAMTWTLMHRIDEKSPLYGNSAKTLTANRSRITVSVGGHDETIAATVYANFNYFAEDIIFDARFVDILTYLPNGGRAINMTRFHEIDY
jgi:inward rectifier potassium channel